MKSMKSIMSLIIFSSLLALPACSASGSAENGEFLPEAQNDTVYALVGDEGELRVSFIDVGQGDSEFIELPNGETLLIDAGTNETGADVVNYIESLGYSSIDYVVGTHPHEDHIGGLDDVIRTFDEESV